MNTALYDIYSGLSARIDALDVLANNLANSSTNGFKQDKVFYEMIQHNLSASSMAPGATRRMTQASAFTDFATGEITPTGRPLDLAIQGKGFFVVQGKAGETLYTRDGSFHVDDQGNLVTSSGDQVLGETGPITLQRGEVTVDSEGGISVDAARSSSLKIVQFEDERQVKKVGDDYFAAPAGITPKPAKGARVVEGSLEKSNVSGIEAVVEMIQVMRQAEALQRSLNTILNEMNTKVIQEVARV